jgi:hypothetical protein
MVVRVENQWCLLSSFPKDKRGEVEKRWEFDVNTSWMDEPVGSGPRVREAGRTVPGERGVSADRRRRVA